MSSGINTPVRLASLGALCVILSNMAFGEEPRLIGVSHIDGEAESLDAWCFGAEEYFAPFAASTYGDISATFTLVPIGASGSYTIDEENNEIIMPAGSQIIHLEAFVADWDPDFYGFPMVKSWMATIDSSTYTSGLSGMLTNSRPPCTIDEDCPDYDTGERCTGTYCDGAWMDCPLRSVLCLDLPACNVSPPDPRCGSTYVGMPAADPGKPSYAMSLRLESSPDAKGTFEVGFVPYPGTFLKDENSADIPLMALLPAKITIEVIACCDVSSWPYVCHENLTVAQCQAMGGLPDPDGTCDNGCHACDTDEECADGDACTDDFCATLCYNVENFDPDNQCCDPVTGGTCPLQEGNFCTEDSCTLPDSRGECVHIPLEEGSPCDDGEPCLTVNDTCIGGECVTTDIRAIPCTRETDCRRLTEGFASCDTETGFCRCIPSECTPPSVVVEGSRYLAVTPVDDPYEVAIRVRGFYYPSVVCVDGYVQPDGRVLEPGPGEPSSDLAVYRSTGPGGWETAHVRGEGIIGGYAYMISADCDPDHPGEFTSAAVHTTLGPRADVGGSAGPDGTVDFVDISMVVDGFRNDWGTPVCCTVDADCAVFGPLARCNTDWPGCETPVETPGRCQSTTANLDLVGTSGCTPDEIIDFTDISAAVDAFRSLPDPCGTPCP